jgi:membrane protease YdiL (CAAX protease family)
VIPLLGADPINQQYAHLAGNLRAVPAMILFIVVGSGFGEETVYRGFLLGILLGSLYLATRQLWLPMMVHASFNLTALGLIFWQLEARVATFLFS